jgi:protein phosphatase 1G
MGRVNGGLNLTRSFGDFDYKANKNLKYDEQMITCKPDVKVFERSPDKDEFIVIGCDGIWERYVDNSQGLIDLVKKYIKDGNDNKQAM